MARDHTLPVYFRYKGKVYESHFYPSYAAVESRGQMVAPTRAAQDAAGLGSVNGWAMWRLSSDEQIGDSLFPAGTPLGKIRPALGIAITPHVWDTQAVSSTPPPPDSAVTFQEPAPKPMKKKAKHRRHSCGIPKPDKATETSGVRVVTQQYAKRGWKVRSVEKDRCGYAPCRRRR